MAKAILEVRGKTYGRSHLGTSVHAGTGFFDHERVLEDGNPDVEIAVEKFLECFNDDQYVHWVDIEKSDARNIGIQLVTSYCLEVSEEFNFVSVETACEPFEIEMPNGIIFEITGRNDRVYERNGRYGIMDLKTGAGIILRSGDVDTAAHGPQLATYELLEVMAGKATGRAISLPAIVMGMSTSTGEIRWQAVENPRTLLWGDDEHMGYLAAAAEIIGRQIYVGNPKSMLCTDKYCPIFDTCFYRRGSK